MGKILELSNINYFYGNKQALCGFDFELNAREIHAITGDHRSGKSTIARILGGALRNQSGNIRLFDKDFDYFTPKTAVNNNIGVVYQIPETVPDMNVVENIFIGRMPHFLITAKDRAYMRQTCRELFTFLNIDLDINTPLRKLSKSELQIVSIARVLSLGARILVLDEISQLLTPSEMKDIYSICRTIRGKDISTIYITSNIDETFRIADRVTVIRDGYRNGTEKVEAVDPSRLATLAYDMVNSPEQIHSTPMHFFTNQEKAIVKDLPIGMVVLDDENTLSFINTSAETILGLRDRERKELSLQSLFSVLDKEELDVISASIESRKECIREQVPATDDRFLRFKSIPLYDADRTYYGTNIFIEDVSFDYDTKEYLLRAERIASTGDLAAGVAHEINNPLGIIQNYVEILSLSTEDKESREQLSQIKKELTKIVEIVGSLLSFSRVQTNPQRTFSIHTLLDEVILLLGHKLRDKDVKLVRKYTEASIFIKGYENKLKQLFMNLIMNAFEAVLTGGIIRVETESFKEHIEISISDNGYGIPDKVNSDIFKPFFSTKMTKTNTGLGLSICQHIAETHKGIITFESHPGNWTTFSVKLPKSPSP